jgi:hypothetical protein
MCDPSFIAVGAQLLGTGMSANAQGDAGDAAAAAAENQAVLADFNAKDAVARGKIDEQLYRMDVKRLQGAQRVAIAASGFDSGGDLAMLAAETAAMGEFGAKTIRTNAMREAYGYKLEGKAQAAQSTYSRRAGELNKNATLLTGVSQAYGTYRQFN